MLRPPGWFRRKLVLRPHTATDDDVPFVDDDSVPGPDGVDPADLAATVMIGDALASRSLSPRACGRDGLIVVVVVPQVLPPWERLVRDAWAAWIRKGQGSTEVDDFPGLSDRRRFPTWIGTEASRRKTMADQRVAAFGKAVAQGRHCLGVTSDVEWLPADMMSVADLVLTLRPLTGRNVGEIARLLAGRVPTETLTDDQAAALTPRTLRLARRLDDGPDDYVGRLRRILAADADRRSERSGGSPRAAPTLDRLHGMREAVDWGMAVARDLAAFRAARIAWADVDRGALLSGPPGCGKTLFARALAATCEAPLVAGSYGEWMSTGTGHQGDLLKAMRKCFAEARASAPSILFIDEIDSFPDRGRLSGQYPEWHVEVVNSLLTEIDGVASRDGVIVLGACNHPDKVDRALIRSGRLDRHIRIGLPDDDDLARILREHLGAELADADLSGVAVLAVGATGADCERFVRGARRRARGENRDLRMADLRAEIAGAEPGPAYLRMVALHEAGHAVANAVLWPGRWQAASLRQTGTTSGGVASGQKQTLVTREHVHHHLMQSLAGRAAEEIGLGFVTAGAGGSQDSDLAAATVTATRALTSLGLEEPESDLLWVAHPDGRELREVLHGDPALADRVRSWLRTAYDDVLALLRENRKALEAVAAVLAEERAIDGARIAAMVAEHAPVPS